MPDKSPNNVVLIAGPTASGKSAAALLVADAINGEIVNADAMQVYEELRIITARPSLEDEARVPHHLYGVLSGAINCSAGVWSRMAAEIIAAIHSRGRVAIIVGGTGLYFRALTEGLSPIPEIDDTHRAAARARFESLGADAFRAEVVARDRAMERLPATDTQRLLRAWEVFEATGKPLSHFQNLPREPVVAGIRAKAILAPERGALYERCNERAAQMINNGGVEEVRTLIEKNLDWSLPVMKALGVPEISAYLGEKIAREQALEQLQQNTRRFAKRQLTWFRNQTKDWPVFETAEELAASIVKETGSERN